MIELVAFLGNHGREYARNRHNAGWLFADRVDFLSGLPWQKKFKGRYAALDSDRLPSPRAGDSGGAASGSAAAGTAAGTPPAAGTRAAVAAARRIHFVKPETYMNLSGDSVFEAAAFFKIPLDRILVVHDELELPLGVASFKFSGGLGGHNGLRSMKARFGSPDFWRLRIGIGRPNHPDVAAWVLSDFAKDEAETLEILCPRLSEAFLRSLISGPESLLPEWNKKRFDA